MTPTRRSAVWAVVGALVAATLVLLVERGATRVAAAEQPLPAQFKIGARVRVLGWDGTFEIAEVQGQWLRGTLGQRETLWLYAPSAQGFIFKTAGTPNATN